MSKLFLVPTPVGNMEDITLRALRILKEVSFILAEDTRKSGNLLRHYDIKTTMVSHHKFNEHATVEKAIKRIKSGEDAALITDAGTPAISDPGFLIVKKCVEEDVEVECLPGPVAFIPALVVSGLPNERFCFEGFLPQKKGRMKRLEALKDETRTMVFYESPYRLVKTLRQLAGVAGKDRKASVSREISKIHEETKRGTLEELEQYFSSKTVKGEIVIILEGK